MSRTCCIYVPAGTHEVFVTYIGLDAARQTVAIGAGQRLARDFDLTTGIYKLEAFRVATNFDGNRPIWSKANIYADAFATYSTRLFRDKVRTRFQLNVRNLQEWKAHLLAVGAYPDGTPHTFRIIEPISVIFTTTFDL